MRAFCPLLVILSLSVCAKASVLTDAILNSNFDSDFDFDFDFNKKAEDTSTRPPVYGAYPANTNLCFPDIGCFSNAFPFNNSGNYLPLSPDEIKTEMMLFTRKNLKQEQIVSYSDINTVKTSNFNKSLPLKIIIHGFSNNRDTAWIHELKDTILRAENVNVLAVGWGNGSAFPLYNNATSNTRIVGRQVGLFINRLRGLLYASSPKSLVIHCIGHSLGSHACAYASNTATVRFNRISGLDPAGPFFEDTDPIVRIDPTDADFVDIIHTNAGTLFSASFGIIMPVGHVDFYVNGGRSQPGCPGLTSILGSLFTGSADPTKDVGCSHNRVLRIFIESITSHCPFTGFNCADDVAFDKGYCRSCADNKCSVMGYNANNYKGRGSMYLQTNSAFPYCGYHHLFEININPNSPKTAGEILISVDAQTNNSPKPMTKSSDDIKPSDVIQKVFVTEHDIIDLKSINMVFNKKSKPFFGSDPNALKFIFDKVKVSNLEINEDFSQCVPNSEISDKQQLKILLNEEDCKL